MKIQAIALPYNVQGKGSGGASGPGALLRGGLLDRIAMQGHELAEPRTVQMSEAEEAEYGGWNRVGLAGGYLARMVGEARLSGAFVLGLHLDILDPSVAPAAGLPSPGELTGEHQRRPSSGVRSRGAGGRRDQSIVCG